MPRVYHSVRYLYYGIRPAFVGGGALSPKPGPLQG